MLIVYASRTSVWHGNFFFGMWLMCHCHCIITNFIIIKIWYYVKIEYISSTYLSVSSKQLTVQYAVRNILIWINFMHLTQLHKVTDHMCVMVLRFFIELFPLVVAANWHLFLAICIAVLFFFNPQDALLAIEFFIWIKSVCDHCDTCSDIQRYVVYHRLVWSDLASHVAQYGHLSRDLDIAVNHNYRNRSFIVSFKKNSLHQENKNRFDRVKGAYIVCCGYKWYKEII